MVRNPLDGVQRANVILGLAIMIASGVLWGRAGFVAAGLGVALACANFWLILRLGSAATRRAASEGGGSAALGPLLAGLTVKMVGLFILIGLVVRGLGLDGLPFGLGISVLVVSLLVCALRAAATEAV